MVAINRWNIRRTACWNFAIVVSIRLIPYFCYIFRNSRMEVWINHACDVLLLMTWWTSFVLACGWRFRTLCLLTVTNNKPMMTCEGVFCLPGDHEKRWSWGNYPGLRWTAGQTPRGFPVKSSSSYDEEPIFFVTRQGRNCGPYFALYFSAALESFIFLL